MYHHPEKIRVELSPEVKRVVSRLKSNHGWMDGCGINLIKYCDVTSLNKDEYYTHTAHRHVYLMTQIYYLWLLAAVY